MALSFLLRPASLDGMQLFDEQYIQSAHVLPVIVVGERNSPLSASPGVEFFRNHLDFKSTPRMRSSLILTVIHCCMKKKKRRRKCCAAVHVVSRVHMYSMA